MQRTRYAVAIAAILFSIAVFGSRSHCQNPDERLRRPIHQSTVSSPSGSAEIDLSVEQKPIYVADPFVVFVSVVVDESNQVEITNLDPNESFGDFGLIRIKSSASIRIATSAMPQARIRHRWEITLEALRTGSLKTGSMNVRITGPNRQTSDHEVPESTIEISSVMPQQADPRQIRGIAESVDDPAGPRPSTIYPYAFAIAGIGLAGVVALIFRRPNPTRKAKLVKDRMATYLQMANESSIDRERAHAAIVQEMKDWLSSRWGTSCQTMTTEEWSLLFRDHDASDQTVSQLQSILGRHDRMAFAGQPIDISDLQSSLDDARDIVDWSCNEGGQKR